MLRRGVALQRARMNRTDRRTKFARTVTSPVREDEPKEITRRHVLKSVTSPRARRNQVGSTQRTGKRAAPAPVPAPARKDDTT